MATETHKVEVVKVKLDPHPNADTLSVVRIHDFTCCVRTTDWRDGDLAAYIQPDSIVDTSRPEFSFLEGHERIRVKKLRGIVSMGLLVKAPAGLQIGDDAAEALGVTHYEPRLPLSAGGEVEAPPAGLYTPTYDVESMYRFAHLFIEGEDVLVTEKIHGANSRFVFRDGRLWAGSRKEWKKQDAGNLWWKALELNPAVEQFCRANPGHIVYGEVYGNVQSLKYGCGPNEYGIAVFDVLRGSKWTPARELLALPLPIVPVIGPVPAPFNLEKLKALAEGPSLLARPIKGQSPQIREGIVVRPMIERTSPELGRVQLKLVSNVYLEKY